MTNVIKISTILSTTSTGFARLIVNAKCVYKSLRIEAVKFLNGMEYHRFLLMGIELFNK